MEIKEQPQEHDTLLNRSSSFRGQENLKQDQDFNIANGQYLIQIVQTTNRKQQNAGEKENFFSSYLIIVVVAFSQGILALSDLGISFLYKDDFQMTPAEVSIAVGLVQIPWILKPFMGLITDSIPFFGYRRKSYLIQFGFISFICWNCLAIFVQNKYQGIICILMIQFCVAFNNVIGEALLVEISQKKAKMYNLSDDEAQKEASKNVTLFFSVKSGGTLITAYLGGRLLEIMDKHRLFQITSIFPLILCVVATLMQEQKYKKEEQINDDNNEHQETQLQTLFRFLKKPKINRPILFIFLYMITPTSSSAMFFYYTNELGFQPEFLGQLKFIYAFGSLSAMFAYNMFLRNVEFKKQFIATSILSVMLGYSQLLLVSRKNLDYGIPDKLFCIGDSIILQVIGELNMLPVLVLACRMCPKNIEGTMYAMIMSTLNLGNLLSSQFGGIVISSLGITQTNFNNLWISICITNTSTLLPLVFINMVTPKDDDNEDLDKRKSINDKSQIKSLNVSRASIGSNMPIDQNMSYGTFSSGKSESGSDDLQKIISEADKQEFLRFRTPSSDCETYQNKIN